ncbi:MAG: polyphosphate kinase 2 [Robiginitomaculum sp.]|nr:MAG: polyphosphate kinase 2 [Robiginitomaculum sp.]
MKRKTYENELRSLQIELCKLQRHVVETDARLCVIFEGRDTAGKGGSIKRVTANLPPREVRAIALPKPNERERDSWYFQRYIPHLPAKGEIVLLDRSWYNRAGVEPVMGFCSEEQHQTFLAAVPHMEEILAKDGIKLIKFWLDIDRTEQAERLEARQVDPLKTWKLSPMDAEAQKRWDAYSAARNSMLEQTDHPHGRWTVIEATDKRKARLAIIRQILQSFAYEACDADLIKPRGKTARSFTPDMLQDGGLHP